MKYVEVRLKDGEVILSRRKLKFKVRKPKKNKNYYGILFVKARTDTDPFIFAAPTFTNPPIVYRKRTDAYVFALNMCTPETKGDSDYTIRVTPRSTTGDLEISADGNGVIRNE